ncbi:MAG: FlgD immunoglobulin-like domain containing protein, partial [Candidatus Cloacimonadales bacterium]|nr:FlgD immunoglobulin-like domain containing protein [Candidatus Cloacimonadales bacterium]
IRIYTITGRKIRNLKAGLCTKGYNQVYWDGKDNDGDRIANNTYFYKVIAKQISSGKTIEVVEKLIMYKSN